MAWNFQEIAIAGNFVMVTISDGVFVDPFGTITGDDMLARVRERARGWTPLYIEWKHGLFGMFGESIRFYGKVDADIPVTLIREQVNAALNSFLAIAAADTSVAVSDNLSVPAPSGTDSWSGTLQLIALAVIVIGTVWGIKQIREITK